MSRILLLRYNNGYKPEVIYMKKLLVLLVVLLAFVFACISVKSEMVWSCIVVIPICSGAISPFIVLIFFNVTTSNTYILYLHYNQADVIFPTENLVDMLSFTGFPCE